jgi:hypothetical protein
MNTTLYKELKYFKANQEKLVKKYDGKFLIIKNRKVEGVYDTLMDAYIKGQKKFELGTFAIQQCIAGKEAYTQYFPSRVSFSFL